MRINNEKNRDVYIIWPTGESGPYKLLKQRKRYSFIEYGDYKIKVPTTWIK